MIKLKILVLISLLAFACSPEKANDSDHHHMAEGKKYTCPMHPSVVQDQPGTCPVCGMDLVEQGATQSDSSGLMLSDTQVKLANITTQEAKVRSIGQSILVNARIAANEELTQTISSRVPGRIERLYYKEEGQPIKKGAPLYELYSENLLTLQEEFLLAKKQYEKLGQVDTRYESIWKAAERKLVLYGLSAGQIDKLSASNQVQPTITFLSPASGLIKEIDVTEGQYVNEGSSLYRVEDTRTLWLEAELYPDEARYVTRGDKMKILISGLEQKEMEATVTFLSPEIKANTQIIVLRAAFSNPDLQVKPGQAAQAIIQQRSKMAISIPIDAVIRDERGAHVYVQTAPNTFAPRPVSTGIENFQSVEITKGIIENELIAVSGAYLLYSEFVLKKGHDPLATIHHQH